VTFSTRIGKWQLIPDEGSACSRHISHSLSAFIGGFCAFPPLTHKHTPTHPRTNTKDTRTHIQMWKGKKNFCIQRKRSFGRFTDW